MLMLHRCFTLGLLAVGLLAFSFVSSLAAEERNGTGREAKTDKRATDSVRLIQGRIVRVDPVKREVVVKGMLSGSPGVLEKEGTREKTSGERGRTEPGR